MNRLAAICLVLALATPVFGIDGVGVVYVGGTPPKLKEGETGRLDWKSPAGLRFETASDSVTIPFAKIDSYEHTQDVVHHLGVLPAIAVGLVKMRRKRHFLRVAFHDDGGAPQVAIFEIPKRLPTILLAVLQERVPQGCRQQAYPRCRQW